MRFLTRDSRELTLIVLRFAAASTFLWFGVDKWVHPEAWYGWAPDWLWKMMPGNTMDSAILMVGALEFAVGCLLASGELLREASAAAFIYLLAITVTLGADEIAVRDMALMGLYLALFLHADANAKRRAPPRVIATSVGLYLLFLFVYGVLFLRTTP